MALFWLTHKTKGGMEVIVVEATHLMMARVKASMAGQQGEFESGIQFGDSTAKKIPTEMIGKTLSREETQRRLKRIA